MLALPTGALATSLDSSSTSKFVAASSRVDRLVLARASQEQASVNAFVTHIQSACPGIVPASIKTGTAAQQRAWRALSSEALGEFGLALIDPVRAAEKRALRAIAPLRWTSATVNRQVAAYAQELRATLALHPPDICAQAKAMASTGFAAIPPATTTFLRRARAATPDSALSAMELADKMKPLADPPARAAIGQLASLEGRVNRAIKHFVLPALGRLERVLFLTLTAGTRAAAR
jgi:hypothetical protein